MTSCAIHTFVIAPTRFSTETMERRKGLAQFYVHKKIIMVTGVYVMWQEFSVQQQLEVCVSNVQCAAAVSSVQQQCAVNSVQQQHAVCSSSEQCVANADSVQQQRAVCRSSVQQQ